MKQMHIDVVMPATGISKALNTWFDENLPTDIRIRMGVKKGRKVVCFTVYGSSQEEIIAKWESLEKVINK